MGDHLFSNLALGWFLIRLLFWVFNFFAFLGILGLGLISFIYGFQQGKYDQAWVSKQKAKDASDEAP